MVNMNDPLLDVDPDENYLNGLFDSLSTGRDSEYYSVDRLNNQPDGESSRLMIICFNIRSFNANIEAFLALLSTVHRQPDIIILTETWISDCDAEFCNIEGYDSYHTIGGRGRGVSVFCRDALVADILPECCFASDNINVCTVRISYMSDKYVILGIYRPHIGTPSDFILALEPLLHSFSNTSVVLTGDFNINILNSQCVDTEMLVTFMQSLHFLPLITKPTRFPPPPNQRGISP